MAALRRRAASLLAAVLALVGAAAAPVARAATRVEAPLPPVPGFEDVAKSVVTLEAPLPASIAGAPAACGQLRYYRFRPAAGPADPQRADAVLVMMPGILGGAASLELNALAVVHHGIAAGRDLEYWALDRRANCVEDHTGLEAAAQAGDARVALDYYLHGATAEGRTFAGFPGAGSLGYLRSFGLRQTLEDERAVIVDGIPDPAVRRAKVFCGGHSLGGLITGALMAWDFDGNRATHADDGARLCAGSVALDTLVTADTRPKGLDPLTRALLAAVAPPDAPPSLDLGFLGPETMQMLEVIGLNAALAPDADVASLLARVPTTGASDQGLRFFHSRDLLDALAPVAHIRRQHLTGKAALGAVLDDDSQPLSFVQASLGSYDAGPFARKSFPGGGVFPADDERLYGWSDYDGALAAYTTPASEVTDINQLARVLPEQPLDFAEPYFPLRLATEVTFALGGSRAGDLRRLVHPRAPLLRPRLTVTAGDGIAPRAVPDGSPGPDNVHVVLAGYNHLDVVTAAARQNDGRPEQSAAQVAAFLIAHARGG